MTRPIIVDAEEQVACPKCNRRFGVPDPDSYEEPGQDTVPNEREDRRAPSTEAIFTSRPSPEPKTNWTVAACLVIAMLAALITFLRSN